MTNCYILLLTLILSNSQLIRSIDHQDCLLRYLCELEALRVDAELKSTAMDPDFEADLILLRVAR